MKQTVLLAAMGLAAFGACAQEIGNVLSSVPVIQQVSVPRTVCQPGAPGPVSTTGGGAVVGGLTGAGVGSFIGQGSGNAAAIAAGTIIGAIVGNNVEAQNQRYAQTAPQCYTQNTLENRTVAYDVTYEYRGQQYSARMPYDPGRSVQLQAPAMAEAAPAGSAGGVVIAPPVQQGQAQVQQPQVIQQQPQVQQAQVAPQQPQYVEGQPQYVQGQPQVIVQQQPTPVVVQQYPVYPAYPYYAPYPYYRPYPYVPFGLSLGFGFYGGGHHHH
jgi:uncharacterized protein YcfJ